MSKMYMNYESAIAEGMADHEERIHSLNKAAVAIAAARRAIYGDSDYWAASAKKIARAMQVARRLGVPNWSLFLNPLKVDSRAYQLANEYLAKKFGPRTKENRGGYDSEGYHGVGNYYIDWAWFQSGCGKDIPKFRVLILSFDKVHKKIGRERIKKSMSDMDVVNLIKGSDWLMKGFGPRGIDNMASKAIITLGKLSFPLRWAAVDGLRDRIINQEGEFQKIRIRDLNWGAVKEAQSHSRMNMRMKFCPMRSKFHHLHGGFFKFWDVERHGNVPDPTKVGHKVLSGLLEEAKVGFGLESGWDVSQEEGIPMLAIASIFTSMEEVKRMQKLTGKSIHDLGQFTPYYGSNKQFWKGLVMKHPEAVEFAGWFPNMDGAGEKPTSLAQLREICAKYSYKGVGSGFEGFAMACSDAKVTQGEFDDYMRYIERTPHKVVETIPHINITGSDVGLDGDWKMETLQSNDPIGLILGRLTNCCQHLHGAGAECAKHGYASGNGCFVAVYYNKKIIAQSWVWRKDDRVVFDSIEALGGAYVEGIAKLYQEVADRIKGKLMIAEVAIGTTSYGITSRVKPLLKTGESSYSRPSDHRGYMDGERHVLIE